MRCMRCQVHRVSDHVFGRKAHQEHGGDYYDLIMLQGMERRDPIWSPRTKKNEPGHAKWIGKAYLSQDLPRHALDLNILLQVS